MSQDYDEIEYEDYEDPVYDMESEEEEKSSQIQHSSSMRPQLLKKVHNILPKSY